MIDHQLRVSRFRPGVPHSGTSTWTSISDVGQLFEDGVLTRDEYERVEGLYLQALDKLLVAAGWPELTVLDLHVAPDASVAARRVTEGAQLRGPEILDVVRLQLREELSCRLDHERFYVHVGFDLYLYVGSLALPDSTIREIEQLGLFVEEGVPSPYATA
jgi:hypothetical protein